MLQSCMFTVFHKTLCHKDKSEGKKCPWLWCLKLCLYGIKELYISKSLTSSAPLCRQVIQGASLQCRKGHLYCRGCRRTNQCRVCQQTFLESPNLGLDRLLGLLSLPCRHGERGCRECVGVLGRAEHENNCPYRQPGTLLVLQAVNTQTSWQLLSSVSLRHDKRHYWRQYAIHKDKAQGKKFP